MAIKIKAPRVLKSLTGLVASAFLTTAVAAPFTGLVAETEDVGLAAPYLSVVIMGGILMSVLAVPVGLLGHAILYAVNWRGLVSYVLAGGGAGLAYILLVSLNGNPDLVKNLILYGLWAAGAAAIAWLIRRPDKDVIVPLDTHF